MDIFPSYSTFYEAFISATAGAVSLDLVRRHKLTPLGSRTFFTTTNENGYENKSVSSNCARGATSLLAILDVEMTLAGKLVIALRCHPQPGLEQLSPDEHLLDMTNTLHNVDLWLAPNGAIARLVSEDKGNSTSISPGLSGVSNHGDEGLKWLDEGARKEWKQSVSRWLKNFGIFLSELETESWTEVEAVSSFEIKPMSNSLRHTGLETPQFTARRIVWPSKLCFKRSKSSFPSSEEYSRCSVVPSQDFLEFAERWLSSADSRNKLLGEKEEVNEVSEFQQQQPSKPLAPSSRKADVPEVLDSLARTVNCPDLQSASSVYPTPPDGALIHGLGAMPSSDGFGAATSDGAYFAMPQTQNEVLPGEDNGMPSASYPKDPDALMTDFAAQPSDYAIGSGLYDTGADEEDLFGGMDEGNFDSKGITEADFSFFDEPDFGDLVEGIGVNHPAQAPQQDQFVKPEPEDEPPQPFPEETKPVKYHDSEGSGQVTGDSSHMGNADKGAHFSPSVSSNINLYHLSRDSKSQSLDRQPNGRHQTLSPPLSPVEIKKILFSDQQLPRDGRTPRDAVQKRSHYDPIPFQQNLNYSDLKYGTAGRFWFSPSRVTKLEGDSKPIKDGSDIPTVGLPELGRKPTKSIQGHTPHTNPDLAVTDPGGAEKSFYPSSEGSDGSDDDSDVLSEHDIPPAILTSGLKRKRLESNLDESTTSSLEKLSLSNDLFASNRGVTEEHSAFLGSFLSDFVDWSFAGFFSLLEPHTSPTLVRKENYIQVAQLLVDQITQSSFSHKLDGLSPISGLGQPKHSMHSLLQGEDILGQTSRLTMEDLIFTPGADSGQSTQQKQINSSQRNDIQGSIAKIPPPHIRIRRGNAYVEVLPPAIAFWETFGLEPSKGKKNIISYCIHPHDAAEGIDAFLERMGLVYSSCNLGTHSRGCSTQAFGDGLVSWNTDSPETTNYQLIMKAIRSICEVLGETCFGISFFSGANFLTGSILAKIPPSDENLLVYIVNPFTNAVAMADLCSAFLYLFQRYIGDADRQHVRRLHELVLQIVPIDFVSSSESIVVPAQVEYLNLALEVYNRCPPQNSPCDLTGSASALSIAKSPPRSIDFRLLPDQPSPLQESRCLHVAYSLSNDQRWVTAAWTDKTGSFQMTMSYCLRNKGSSVSRLISSVRQEIWETSRDIMEKFQTRWKVFLVRDEPVDMEEVEGIRSDHRK